MTNNKPAKVLMIAFDFPPCQSAGVQRTLKFANYLTDFGWQPIVLTVKEPAHARIDHSQNISPELAQYVYRTTALDASRHFAIKGKYFSWSKIPDKWWTWALTAVRKGKELIKHYQPDLIWSTYPIPTAHYIAYRLSQKSGLPWIADFRDPVQCRYDPGAQQYAWATKWIERRTIHNARKAVFTTQQAANLYADIYPFESKEKFCVIQNGFDEQTFQNLNLPYQTTEKFQLLYSGAIYANGRDPSALFSSLASLKQKGVIHAENFEMVFQGAGSGVEFASKIQQLDIADLIRFTDSVPYTKSLEAMSNASALLVIQDSLFKNQIPGKIYEYLRVGKPILAMTPKKSATGELISRFKHCHIAMESDAIENAILSLLKAPPYIEHQNMDSYSRYSRTKELATLFNKEINRA